MEQNDDSTTVIPPETEQQRLPYCILNILDTDRDTMTTLHLTHEEVMQIASGKRPDILSKEDIRKLARIERKAFNPLISTEYQLSEDDLREFFSHMQGPQFIIREHGVIAAYFITRPAPDAHEEFRTLGLLDDDPDFSSDPHALYLESIAGSLGHISNATHILQVLESQALQYGYQRLCCHGINPILNRALIRLRGFRIIRTLDHWLDTHADYLEKNLDIAPITD